MLDGKTNMSDSIQRFDGSDSRKVEQVLDLFAGAGGLSIGFANAGYGVVAGVDYDEDAVATFEANHDARGIQEDLAEMEPSDFAEQYDIHREDVDVVIGGPPCQGFSTANMERDADDPRNNLVFVFAEYVDYYQPDTFLMENVTGITNIDDGETVTLLVDAFNDAGYTVEYRTLNAANYGVPQRRKRVFFQGQMDGEPTWPEQTHASAEEVNDVDAREVSDGETA